MSSSASQYFQNSKSYQQYSNFPQYAQNYVPMVNVPTLNKLPTHGELVASIELLTATINQFSTRLDRIESRVNDWVNIGLAERMSINEKSISDLKKSHEESNDKIVSTTKDMDYAYESIRDTNYRIRNNERYIDRLSDTVLEHTSKLHRSKQHSRNLTRKYAEVAILRRRVSKVENFNTEFIECFETPDRLRGIVSELSSQLEECDKTVAEIVRYGCSICDSSNPGVSANGWGEGGDTNEVSNFCDSYEGMRDSYGNIVDTNMVDEDENDNQNDNGIEPWKNVESYFSNYYDIDNMQPECVQPNNPQSNELVLEDDDYEKL
jgi:uncharacterized coiled-coil protein SlyX